jgi:hypothetical protein
MRRSKMQFWETLKDTELCGGRSRPSLGVLGSGATVITCRWLRNRHNL